MYKYYYRFRNVSVELFDRKEEFYSSGVPTDFDADVAFNFIKEEKLLRCKFTIVVSQAKEEILKTVFVCNFDIKDESIKEATQEDRSVIFAKSLLIQLASLNYGTLRGVLVERLRGSKMASIILPPLYMESIIKDDYIFRDIQ